MMRKLEPTALWSDSVFALREVASRVKNLPARLMAGARAGGVRKASAGKPVLCYGYPASRQPGGLPIGGEIKLIPLRGKFPGNFKEFNLLYLVSSALPDHVEELVRVAKRAGIFLVWNQNGVAYPGCYGDFYPWFNQRMARLRSQADYVFNQSEFSRLSAERYLGPSEAPFEIIHNPVDVQMFSPGVPLETSGPWHLLSAGTSHALYRTKSALDTLRCLLGRGHRVHLTLAGEFRWRNSLPEVAREMKGMEDCVTVHPPFRQSDAPEIYRKAHILLHTKFNDPCPTVPIEAMACGVPVVGTCSGGMPELVPETCGRLVPIGKSWVEDRAGDPELLADAVEEVMANHRAVAEAAREHAVATFDVMRWLDRHEVVFNSLLHPSSR